MTNIGDVDIMQQFKRALYFAAPFHNSYKKGGHKNRMNGMRKIWIAGANGQIGTALNEVVDPLEFELLNTDKEERDVTDIDEVILFAEMNRPDVIVNCAAVTDTKLCEENPTHAFRVNALGARNLSIAARKIGAKLVQLSTDDVFDGQTTKPYCEFDDTNPITVYGKSKRAGENYVKEFTYKHFIIRSSWIYGKGKNFVTSFLERIQSESVISVASDQYGCPTSANALAKLIFYLITTNEYGTYHATCAGKCSRFEFAEEILKLSKTDRRLIKIPTPLDEHVSVRPAYAVLDNFILNILGTYQMPEWKDALKEYMGGM